MVDVFFCCSPFCLQSCFSKSAFALELQGSCHAPHIKYDADAQTNTFYYCCAKCLKPLQKPIGQSLESSNHCQSNAIERHQVFHPKTLLRGQLICLTGSLGSPRLWPEEEPSTREETEMASFDCAKPSRASVGSVKGKGFI